jgi:hypothetical protein
MCALLSGQSNEGLGLVAWLLGIGRWLAGLDKSFALTLIGKGWADKVLIAAIFTIIGSDRAGSRTNDVIIDADVVDMHRARRANSSANWRVSTFVEDDIDIIERAGRRDAGCCKLDWSKYYMGVTIASDSLYAAIWLLLPTDCLPANPCRSHLPRPQT